MNPEARASDPTHRADMPGYRPKMILTDQRTNDGIRQCMAQQTIKQLIASGSNVDGGAFIDVKATFDGPALEAAGYRLWRL